MHKSTVLLLSLLLLLTSLSFSQHLAKSDIKTSLRNVDHSKIINTPLAPASEYSNKMDPLLRYVAGVAKENDYRSNSILEKFSSQNMLLSLEEGPDGSVMVPIFIKSHNPISTITAITAHGGYVTTASRGILVARIPVSSIEILTERSEVQYLEVGTKSDPKLDVSHVEIDANVVHAGTGLPQSYKGSGVVVGVVDSGIDWKHEDFDNGSGTRIQYLWDMSGTGNPPSGYTYGTEYTKAQIDANQCQEIDGDDGGGHGTHVSATAAGKDNALAGYTGIAPEADIVFVKGFRSGPGFANTDVVDGCSYIFSKALAMGEPCVINLSLGGHLGAHDGTSLYEQSLSNLTGPGRIIIAAAGNEGGKFNHLSYTTGGSNINEARQTFWYIPPGTPVSLADMWYDSGNISVGIAAFDDNLNFLGATNPVPPGQYIANLPFTVGAQTLAIVSIDAQTVSDPNNGASRVVFAIDSDGQYNLNAVWWALYTFGTGTFDAWMVAGGNFTTDSDPPNFIMPGDNNKSIGIPGTAQNVICVGSYVTKTQWIDIDGVTQNQPGNPTMGDISSFSSLGPTRDNRLKPDLAAPGEAILAALSSDVTIGPNHTPRSDILLGGKHKKFQGTSMASPHVTGTVALMLQRNSTLDYAQVFNILTTTTVRDGFTGTSPNNTFGNGKLNAFNAVQQTPDGGSGGTPVEIGKLTASDGAADEYFGNSVAIDGDLAVVGAHFDDDNGWGAGSAYVFHWNGTAWDEEAKLTASDGSQYHFFGSSVAIDGELVIVGAPGASIGGAAYIFRRNGTSWIEDEIITASDAAMNDNFGTSVSLSGDRALIGASGDYLSTGAAYIFKRNGSNWSEEEKLTANDGIAYDYFGISVSIDENICVVGARDHNLKGAVYVFGLDGASWELEDKLIASDGGSGDKFGASVSKSNDVIVIGARFDDDNGLDSGSAYVFRKDGNSWNEEVKLTALDGEEDDRFGNAVVKGDVILVSATHDDDNGLNSGAVYVYRWGGSNWDFNTKVIASDGYSGDWFGSSLAISSNYFIVGSPYDNDNGSDSGSSYVYEFHVTSIDDNTNTLANIPTQFILFQNYPNPFNPSTTIKFGLKKTSNVVVEVFSVSGQRVVTLLNDSRKAGYHSLQWNGKNESGISVASGLYIYRLRADNTIRIKKMILLR